MATKLGRIVTYPERFLLIKLFDPFALVVLRDHVANQKSHTLIHKVTRPLDHVVLYNHVTKNPLYLH